MQSTKIITKLKKRLSKLNQKKYLSWFKQNYQLLTPLLLIPLIIIPLFLSHQPQKQTLQNELNRQLIGPWDYTGQIHAQDIQTGFRKTNKGGEIKIARNSSELQFLIPIEKTKIEKKDDKIVYSSSDNSISAQYEQIKNGIKEEIILNKKPNTNVFMSQLKLKKLNLKVTTSGVPVFFGENDQYQFHFAEPFAYDAQGNRTNAVKFIIHPTEQTENKVKGENTNKNNGTIKELLQPENPKYLTNSYVVEIEVDKNWLNSPDRVYPIVIDPTVVHDEDSDFAGSNFRTADEDGTSSVEIKSTYQEITPSDPHLVGLWHMNNDWTDSSGNGNNGTANGGASFTTSSKLGSHAGTFDGDGDYVTVSDDDTLEGMDEFTISGWLYHDSIDTRDDDIFVKGDHNSSEPFVFWRDEDTTDSYAFLVTDDDTDYSGVKNSSFVPISQQWTHVAITFIGNNQAHLYINGKEDTNSPWDMSTIDEIAITTDDLYIGNCASIADKEFRGDMDELAFYDRALSPEEIKAQASRRPYGVYTSQVVDLARVLSWNDLSWTEVGVATGNGETVADDTDLVAQWNFNENSGTTANNDAEGSSCGGTPSNCDGTLTNFSNTSSQDADPGSGWTAENGRWPKSNPEALMFDGTDDYVNVGNDSSITTDLESGFTFEVWAKTSNTSDHQRIIDNDYAANSFQFSIDDAQNVRLSIFDGSTWNNTIGNGSNLADGNWHHLVGTYDGSDAKVYADGKLQVTSVGIGASFTANNVHIGVKGQDLPGTYTQPFNGIIDSVRIYSRALSQDEILSNYNAGNIEIQTRTGSDSTPNDGDWEEWKPASSETQIDNYDNNYLYDTSTSGLVSYWPMDESSWTDDCSTDTVTDVAGSNEGHACPNGSGPIGGLTEAKFGKSGYFDGSDDHLEIADSSDFDFGTGAFSISFWFKKVNEDRGDPFNKKSSDSTDDFGILLRDDETMDVYFKIDDSGGLVVDNGNTFTLNDWHHAVIVRDNSSNINTYIDGKADGSGTSSGNMDNNSAPIWIGTNHDGSWNPTAPFEGLIDEVQIYNTALSVSTIQEMYNKGVEQFGISTISNQSDSNIYYEGSGAEKFNTGAPKVDGNTVALYHLDETNMELAGDDIFDATSNSNDGELTGTTVVDGISGKARGFDGDDYIQVSDDNSLDLTTDLTIQAWIYQSSQGAEDMIVNKESTYEFAVRSGELYWAIMTNSSWEWHDTDVAIPSNQWTHVVFTYNGTNVKAYKNGVLESSIADPDGGAIDTTSRDLGIGARDVDDTPSSYFTGKIDEVKISNVERSAEEIAAEYRAGRDHRLNRTISSIDLTSSTKLPFYIAADEPGTWIEATIGESAFANYMPDENTVGYWRMEESRQTPEEEISSDSNGLVGLWHMNNDWTDSSGNGNNGTANGGASFTTSSKLGSHAGTFDGDGDYTTISNDQSLNFDSDESFSVTAWVKLDTQESNAAILSKTPAYDDDQVNYALDQSDSLGWKFVVSDGSGTGGHSDSIYGSKNYVTDRWVHLVGTYNASADKMNLYVDGQFQSSTTVTNGPTSNSANLYIGSYYTGNYFDGQIDEVAIYDRALSPEEIEMMYGAKIKDYSGNGNTGYGQGGNITQGKIGKGREFDGSNDFVQIEDNSIFDTGDEITVSHWFKTSTNQSSNGMLVHDSSNYKYLTYLTTNSGTICFYVRTASGTTAACWETSTDGYFADGNWHYFTGVYDRSTTPRVRLYINGQLRGTATGYDEAISDGDEGINIGRWNSGNEFTGSLDEVRIDDIARGAEQIRQAYEIGRRTHPITIEFADKLDSNDLLTDSFDPGFRLANEDGQANHLHAGEKVIVKENYGGTEYIAQGTVTSVDTSSGSVVVASWDGNSTFPTNGFTAEADIFKWQREYWDISGILDSQVNVATELTFRILNGDQGRTFWLDDFVHGGAYMTDSSSTSINSTTNRYFQYRAIFSSWDPYVSSALESATIDYDDNTAPNTPTNLTPEDGATIEPLNPELTSSDFSDADGDGHESSQWQISTSDGSFDSNIVWDSGTDESNLRRIVVDDTNGTFQGDLTGETQLADDTTYYWRVRYYDDFVYGDWSSYSTITSFTVIDVELTDYCSLEPAGDNSEIVVNWTDNNDSEDNYEIERNVNSSGFSDLTTEAANSTSYTDTDVSTGNTYQYRIAPVSGSTTGEWCTTDTVTLGEGDFNMEGINMEGINID
jgi:hypothetical protein